MNQQKQHKANDLFSRKSVDNSDIIKSRQVVVLVTVIFFASGIIGIVLRLFFNLTGGILVVFDCTLMMALFLIMAVFIFKYVMVLKGSGRNEILQQYYDSLTGLPNRAHFVQCLKDVIDKENNEDSIMGVMLLDLDRFKLINDTLGYETGDLLLKVAADRLNEYINSENMVFRMSGDEFSILLTGMYSKQKIGKFCNEILDLIKQPYKIHEQEIFITVSAGLSVFPWDSNDAEELIKDADMAMLRAKERGRNTYQFYTTDMNVDAVKRLNMKNDLRKAIERNELELYYQPQIDVVAGKIIGAEALLRWFHPKLGMISPSDFISLAEETELIFPIGEWVLRTACHQMKIWQNSGFTALKVSVNISARQFQQDDLIEMIESILCETGLDPKYVELEITENLIMKDIKRTTSIIHKLKKMGLIICIDDFGTGFSSLNYLKNFEIDVLKIDRSFVRDIITDANDAVITATIINMAHELNLRVIAEGVENEEQLAFLKEKRCYEIQGYIFSEPVSTDKFERMLASAKK